MHRMDKHKQSTCRRLLKTEKRCFLVAVLLVAVFTVIYLLDVTVAARPSFILQTLWMITISGTRVSPTSPFSTTTITTTTTTLTTTTTTTSTTTNSIIVNTTNEPRSSLWSFRLRDDIARLYATPAYPKHHPNTVIAEYTCVQHSKYAIIMDVIKNRGEIPASRVYAWIDVGYYRNPENMNYCLKLPSDFDEKMPSYNQVFPPNFQQFPKNIFYDNHVWVGGGMFIATRNTMITLCNEYQRATRYLLYNMSLSSTDQQCLYASFTNDGRRDIRFGLELNVRPGGHDWFELGYQCLHELRTENITRGIGLDSTTHQTGTNQTKQAAASRSLQAG